MAHIEFRALEKVYGEGVAAIRSLTFDVEAGEFLVVVGPSGCGKSTLLRLLAGLEQPTAGDIRIGARRVNDWAPQRRNVAMVFQNYALYPHMTVRENLAFPLRMQKTPKTEIRQRVEETAALLDLTALLERKPKALSGGQRQRVAMGRAVVRRPDVFLMDEPLSNLDAKLRVQIRAEIAALQRRLGVTTFYVTHDQVEAMTLGHRVAVLRAGVLQQVDTPQRLYQQPANAFVAAFLGNPGMNLFPVKALRSDGPRLVLNLGGQELEIRRPSEVAQAVVAQGELIAGVRPEALFPGATDSATAKIPMAVEAIESLGHERLIYGRFTDGERDLGATLQGLDGVTADPSSLVARVPADFAATIGSRVLMEFRPDDLYLFDHQGAVLAGQ